MIPALCHICYGPDPDSRNGDGEPQHRACEEALGSVMTQTAPFPVELAEMVARLAYRPGWTFTLSHLDRDQGSEGLTLDIVTLGYNSYHPEQGEHYAVHHYMPVPPALYNRQSWQRWLFEQLLLVERHEACEFFRFEWDTPNQIGTETLGTNHHVNRPYAPNHGPGWDPYIVTELTTNLDRRTRFTGEVGD